ncbi:MAG TPA: glycoside hydrolase family 3 N-terminal domain-containing protein [bacterium]|nr:glycoside hydrolase family 3 N-terminal domain-containing protein [bacterium]HPN45303.1 glycoside hydrolase family 3 N-terminal domain-containing protein [bacterium]
MNCMTTKTTTTAKDPEIEKKVNALLTKMTLQEKIGQMMQQHLGDELNDATKEAIRKGQIGSFLNAGNVEIKNEIQRIATKESRLGIPLIFGRDVIHGYKTIIPIPLGQAASWNPELVEKGARVAAIEASSEGVKWTFAPMIDIARDPRWGRIAESCGEDPYLTSVLGAAMVRGFQGDNLADPSSIAACAKHYVGYGAAEGGRDYNTTLIPERQLRDVYLPSFHAAVKTGVATLMSAFNDINGVPASGNEFTLRQVLRNEWKFDGFVVSDWTSMTEMIAHGYCKDEAEVALKSLKAGVDMEMVSQSYLNKLEELIKSGAVSEKLVDEAVKNILRIKFRAGLFDNPITDTSKPSVILAPEHLAAAKDIAVQSMVLLQNKNDLLPVTKGKRVAIIGPLADAPLDQMGTWVLDGNAANSVTPLKAIREMIGESNVQYAPGLTTSRTTETAGFAKAVQAARQSDVVLLFIGEEQILSGEAHSRAFLNLPGAQEELVAALAATGKPIAAIIMAGRPLTFRTVADKVQAILYAWHPGTMGGPAIADVVFGVANPSGKLPVTFPRTVGQAPIYYAHKNTGRPPSASELGIPLGTPLDPRGFTSKYLDVDFTPEYPFGYGLSYTRFEYSNIQVSAPQIKMGGKLTVTAEVKNTGQVPGEEVVQLYVQDLFGSVTRPVKELKGFTRVALQPGESKTVSFDLSTDDLAFYDINMKFTAEPGDFHVWIGGNSAEGVMTDFAIVD